MHRTRLYTTSFNSPAGQLLLSATEAELVCCDWAYGWHRASIAARIKRHLNFLEVNETNDLLEKTKRELAQYFAGKRLKFDLPLLFLGTDFQKDVWRALKTLPNGVICTYGDIARQVGRPKAVRAVGVAVGENPFSIIVPCHRIVGHNGRLTGYGGGLAAKKALLAIEGFEIEKDQVKTN